MPTQDWGRTPLPGDVHPLDDVERIREHRNKIHDAGFKIEKFKDKMEDLSKVHCRKSNTFYIPLLTLLLKPDSDSII